MSKHTPGPWIFRPVHSITNRPATALLLETLSPYRPFNDPCILAVREDWIGWLLGTEKGQANARLIAAAPDLLEFARECARADSDCGPMIRDAARAAIAKAEGGGR